MKPRRSIAPIATALLALAQLAAPARAAPDLDSLIVPEPPALVPRKPTEDIRRLLRPEASIIEARNRLDGLIFTTRRSLDEYGDLIGPGDARAIKDAVEAGETALDSRDRKVIEAAHEGLAIVAQRISEGIYNHARQTAPSAPAIGAGDMVDD